MPLSHRAPRRSGLGSRRSRLASVIALSTLGLLAAFLPSAGVQAVGSNARPTAAVQLDDDDLNPFLGGKPEHGNVDRRAGGLAPTQAQRNEVRGLSATASWNAYGTPQSLINHGGYLGSGGPGAAAADALGWLRAHNALFRLTDREVDALELVSVQTMPQSAGSAVLFRQRFGGLPAAVDGMVTLGVANNKIAYVSSSIAGATDALGGNNLSAVQAWLRAAADVDQNVVAADVSNIRNEDGWTVFDVDDFAQPQQARLRALPAPDGNTRRVWEANVVNVVGGEALGVTSFVDAGSGNVMVRQNRVDHYAAGGGLPSTASPSAASPSAALPMSEYTDTFTGAYTAADPCGPRHPFTVDAATETIIYSAEAAVPANDIVIKLYDPSGTVVSSQDTGTSPEAQVFTGPVVAGEYEVEVCAFEGADPVVAGEYTGTFTASEQRANGIAYPPKWTYFLANPVLNFTPGNTPQNRDTGCWESSVAGAAVEGCDNPPSDLINLAARAPWDYNFRANAPTFKTIGNAAFTAEAWVNPPTVVFGNLTPGAFGQQPFEIDRDYTQPFEDVWNNQRCNPATLTPGGNDILPSVTHLFASHNRMHDYSYFLGFTEENYNLQDVNFGLQGREGDPEIGNVQSGAITGGAPLYGGRDNANQLTLQDGIPGITNQYLFQPIAGAFYSPCVDGDYDFGVVGHEYTHAISNRMVGGPDSGLSGFQAGSMGESWSDQVASEYLLAHDYDPGVSPFVEGAYVTGNLETGIRNYRLDDNPLQYGDLGYDFTGPEVHADGEPWSAVNIDIRQALIRDYNGQFPASNARLQRLCAQGDTFASPPQQPLPADRCPGNRRWIQLMFDSFLMQQPATSMLDARDAMLAADVMRFGGANQRTLWYEFANNGFGDNADTTSTEDDEPTPGYVSPLGPEGTLRITANDFSKRSQPPVSGTLYASQYEARVTPVADTDPSTPLKNTVKMVPGTYDFVFQADGFGLSRFGRTIVAGQTNTRNLHLAPNLASSNAGASVDGSSAGVNQTKLIDDTEASNWAGQNPAGVSVDTPAAHPFVNVDLAGDEQIVRSVQVSAMLRPDDPGQEEDPEQPDEDSGSRFTALRDFAIETCTQSTTSDCSSTVPSGAGSPYTEIFNSRDGLGADDAAFDSTLPRPLAPDLILDKFDVPDTQATHVRLVALENQCSGAPEYAGEQDDDPLNATDCKIETDRDESVRAAELEVFSFDTSTRPPQDPVVAMTMDAPATVAPGERIAYELTYTNLGPQPSAEAAITDVLPDELAFVSASDGGTYTAGSDTVRWDRGTVAVNVTDSVRLVARVPATTAPATVILNQAQFAGALTFSPPAAAVTTVTDLPVSPGG